MKNLIKIAILFASTCVVSSAMAQDPQVRVKVPFNFTVGSTTLPAGTYSVSPIGNTWIIKVDNLSGHGGHVLAMSQAASTEPVQPDTAVFHRVGTRYFLSDLRSDGSYINLHMPTSKEEKRAVAEALQAGLRAKDTVLVALR